MYYLALAPPLARIYQQASLGHSTLPTSELQPKEDEELGLVSLVAAEEA